MEQRGQQNLNHTLSTHSSLSRAIHEHKQKLASTSRWVRISLRAQNTSAVFSNLLTHVNVNSLREAFKAINGRKALGVDGVSKEKYGMNLEDNLKDLESRIQKGTYRPMPKREVLIPKANGKTRPIAIACFEDKLVDWVVGKILTQIYEPIFIRNSFGYRPNKSADEAVKACYFSLHKNRRPFVVEIDFSGFFNTIPHHKLMRILGEKITDRGFKGLIGRFLKGGLINKEEEILPSKVGTPQGSIMSPILSNIYLNEMLDQWFLREIGSYNNIIVRYADDAVFFFKKEDDARKFMENLRERVSSFKLFLNEDKTHIVDLNKSKNNHFHFLGFTFYWGPQGSRRILKVKTQKEKLIKGIQEFYFWIKSIRNQTKLKEIWSIAKAKIRGHVNYYGYQMNALKINHFYYEALRSLFKWLNRRSQKRSYSWEGFEERIKNFPLVEPLDKLKLKRFGWNPYANIH